MDDGVPSMMMHWKKYAQNNINKIKNSIFFIFFHFYQFCI
jgi:hypothetical protein